MSVGEASRVEAARARLQRFSSGEQEGGNRGWTPAWSSRVLEEEVDRILSASDSRVSDLFKALWPLLEQRKSELNRSLVNFIRDIVILTFTRYRSQYDAADFEWMADKVAAGGTPAQAYLAAMALPPELLHRSRAAILEAMKENQLLDEVTKLVSEE
jgi:hypothetical protein